MLHRFAHCSLPIEKGLGPVFKAPATFLGSNSGEASMRITSSAALLLVIASTLLACVHETTVFHSLNGTNYFRGTQ